MDEWKRIPGTTCEALKNSVSKRFKVVLENNGCHTKHWHLTNFHFRVYSLRAVPLLPDV